METKDYLESIHTAGPKCPQINWKRYCEFVRCTAANDFDRMGFLCQDQLQN